MKFLRAGGGVEGAALSVQIELKLNLELDRRSSNFVFQKTPHIFARPGLCKEFQNITKA